MDIFEKTEVATLVQSPMNITISRINAQAEKEMAVYILCEDL